MIVYKDIISGDEMMTDSFQHNSVVGSDGNTVNGIFEVESSNIVKGEDNIDIGCGNAFGSTEEEQVDSSVEKVNNIVDSFKYTEIPFGSKGELKEYLKTYVRAVRAKLKEIGLPQPEIKEFMAQAPAIVMFILSKYNDMQTFAGESMDPDAGMAFGYYKDGAVSPTFIYITKALTAEKF